MGFQNLVGNEPVQKSLMNALMTDRIANAYVFEGIGGIGKRFCAKIFAKGLVCEGNNPAHKPCDICSACAKVASDNHPDIIYLTQASDKVSIGVDDVREQILSEIYMKPYLAKRKVVIIGNGDALSTEAQNALLKVLEEPPEYVVFIICVTNQDRLLDTVLSRSHVMSFFPLSTEEVRAYLEKHYEQSERILFAASLSQGSIGAAVAFLSDENTESLFEKSIAQITALTRDASKVYEMAEFLIKEKERVHLVINFLMTFLRDCVFVKSGLEPQVIYKNCLSQMRVFTAETSKKSLVVAFDRLTDLKLRMKQNLNYSASVYETVMRIWEDFHDKGSGHSI